MRLRGVLPAVVILAVSPPAAQERSGAEPVQIVRGQVRSDDDGAMLLRRTRISILGATDQPVFTDSEGRFEIAVRRARSTTLRLAKPGFAARHVRLPSSLPDDPLDIRLARGAAIVGRVVDEQGTPVVSLDVRVRSVEPAPDAVPINSSVRTDDQGEWRAGSLPAGAYEVTVVSRGESDQPVTVQLQPGEETGLELFHAAGARDVRSASSYAAGFQDAQEALLASDPVARRLRRGTAVITGRVMGPDGRGVAGAIVRLNPASAGLSRVAASSASGAYAFRGIPAGRYRMVATKVGFIEGEYGRTRAAQPGRVLTIRDGQRLDAADVGLQRGGVVVGTLSDADGEPLEGLAVHAWRVEFRSGSPVAEPVGEVDVRRTDDRGRYRLHGLQPGAYYIVASDDPGDATRPTRSVSNAPRSYYPGVGSLFEASLVAIDVGMASVAADFVFAPEATFRIRGQARDSDDTPLRRVTLIHRNRAGGTALPPRMVGVGPGDAFEFTHVPSGDYVLQGAEPSEFAKLPFRVSDGDLTLPLLRTSIGSTLAGRVVSEGGQMPWLSRAWIDVVYMDADDDPAPGESRPVTITFRNNSTIELSGLAGLIRFAGNDSMPEGWYLKAVEIEGRNAVDQPVAFRGAARSRADVRIVVSNAVAEISGRALDGRNEAAGSYVAVAFPADTRRWLPGSRHVRTAVPDEQGQFRFSTLAPGEYLIAALESIDERRLQDPAMLNALREVSTRVDLSPGEQLDTDVRLARVQ